MKMYLDRDGCLFIDGESKYCMYDMKTYCSIKCAQFSKPDIRKDKPSYPGDMSGDVFIYLCHNKEWTCKLEDFTDNRVKVSNA